MPSFNKCFFMGNLTRDPEMKYTPKGQAIADFGLAINRNYTTADGEKREEVTFINVTAFGKQAETIGQYMKKGRPLFVECHTKIDSWDDKQTGQKRSAVKFIVDGFQFLGGKRDDDGGGDDQGGDYDDRTQQQPQRPPQGQRQPQGQAQRPQGGGGYGSSNRPPRPPSDPDLDAAPDDIPF